jgi:hypothetical protein
MKTKKPSKQSQSKYICFRIDVDQYDLLRENCKQTTCRSLSQYIRKLLSAGPVTVNYRNATMEELIVELSALRGELAHVSRTFESAVDQLGGFQNAQQLGSWLLRFETEKRDLATQIHSINEYIKITAKQWLQ